MFVKIAPDLDEAALAELAAVLRDSGIDGAIATNTTLTRDGLASRHASETGGLSGAPLFRLSTRILARLYRHLDGKLPIIGVGGVGSVDEAWAKLEAGASALQIYSALIYQGFSGRPHCPRAGCAAQVRKHHACGADRQRRRPLGRLRG